jgi:hypothetical protein
VESGDGLFEGLTGLCARATGDDLCSKWTDDPAEGLLAARAVSTSPSRRGALLSRFAKWFLVHVVERLGLP